MKALQVYGKGYNFSLETYTGFMPFKAFTSIPASQITVPPQPSRTPLLSMYYFSSSSFGPVFEDKDPDSIFPHSVSKIQSSSTKFPVLRTSMYLCFIKNPSLCRVKEMDNSMNPRETILYNNWEKNKSVFHKREGKNSFPMVSSFPYRSGTSYRNNISCPLPYKHLQAPKMMEKEGKRALTTSFGVYHHLFFPEMGEK